MSIELNGTNQFLLTEAVLPFATNLSYSGWITPKLAFTLRQTLIGHVPSGNNNSNHIKNWLFIDNTTGLLGYDNRPVGSAEVGAAYSNTPVVLNERLHFVVTVTPTEVRFLINGKLDNVVVFADAYTGTLPQLTYLFAKTDQGELEFFGGTAEDFRIYDRTISDIEAQSIYNSQGGDAIIYGLKAKWLFNDNSPNTETLPITSTFIPSDTTPTTSTLNDLSGLTLWIDTTAISGTHGESISTLTDLSTSNNSATSMSTSASPTLIVSGGINENQTISFDGDDDFMQFQKKILNNLNSFDLFLVYLAEENNINGAVIFSELENKLNITSTNPTSGIVWGVDAISFKNSVSTQFNGTDDVIEGPASNSIITNTNGVTLSCWFKTTNTSPRYLMSIKRSGVTSTYVSIGVGNGVAGSIYMLTYNGGGHTTFQLGSGYNDNNWHHVVGISNASVQSIYVDGVLLGTLGGVLSGSAGVDPYVVGGFMPSFGSLFFEGFIDEPSVHTILTSAQIVDMFNNSPQDLSKFDPHVWWRMGDDTLDDDTIDTGIITDQTTGGFDGIPRGTTLSFVNDSPHPTSGANDLIQGTNNTLNSTQILNLRRDGDLYELYENFTLSTSGTYTVPTSTNSFPTLGSDKFQTKNSKVQIGEFAVYAKRLNSLEYEKVNAILAYKWFPQKLVHLDSSVTESVLLTNTNTVSGMLDQSIMQNDLQQSSLTLQPIYEENSINGLPSVHYDGIDNYMTFNNFIFSNRNSFEVFLVVDVPTWNGNSDRIFSEEGGSLPFRIFFRSTSPIYGIRIQTNATNNSTLRSTDYIIGKPIVINCFFDGTQISLYINGIFQETDNLVAPLDTSSFIPRIGARSDTGGSDCEIKFGELIVYDKPLTPDQRISKTSELVRKWIPQNGIITGGIEDTSGNGFKQNPMGAPLFADGINKSRQKKG